MAKKADNPVDKLKGYKIIFPIIIGLGVAFALLYKDLNIERLRISTIEAEDIDSWYKIKKNERYDTIGINITNEEIIRKDTIKLQLQYFIHTDENINDFIDTICFTDQHFEYCSKDNFIENAVRTAPNKISISFSQPLKNPFSIIQFTQQSIFWLIVALFLMVFRDLGYIIRLKILTDQKLSWLQSLRVIMLWEFTSAVTPSAIGGTSLAIIYVNKEGLSVGRSSAVVMATSFLDELYFIIMFPLLFILIDPERLFEIGGGLNIYNEFLLFAIIGYSLKLIYNIVLSYGLFINPRGLKWLILQAFRLPVLRKWRQSANKAGDEIIVSSHELINKPFSFWLKSFVATILSWTSRYWVVNAIFLAFFVVDEHFLLFARQLIMWIMMLVSPTPGGSGFTEFVFAKYLIDFLPYASIAGIMAIFWRIATYYPYLFIGAFLVPRWLKSKFKIKPIHLHKSKKATGNH